MFKVHTMILIKCIQEFLTTIPFVRDAEDLSIRRLLCVKLFVGFALSSLS